MKNLFKVIVTLLFTFAILGLMLPAAVSASSNTNTNAAQNAAQNWLEGVVAVNNEIPQWDGSTVVFQQQYDNLNGEVDAYMFEIDGKTGIVGFILVGSSQYNYDILEAGASSPPAVPSMDIVQEAIGSLGLKMSNTSISTSTNFVYTGVDGYYAVYSVQNQKVAINLISKSACLFSSLTPFITPSDYQQNKIVTAQSQSEINPLSSGWDALPMSAWNDVSPSWCGPCSGVSIGAYYRDYMGYSGLPDNLDMYYYLYFSMYTSQFGGATMPWYYGPGFTEMTSGYGYPGVFSYTTDYAITSGDYWNVVNDINSGWPLALEITNDLHYRAIRGYSYSTGIPNYIICTNSETGDSWDILNWNTLGFGLFTCTIIN